MWHSSVSSSSPVASWDSKVSIIGTLQNFSRWKKDHLDTFCVLFYDYCEFCHTSFVTYCFSSICDFVNADTTSKLKRWKLKIISIRLHEVLTCTLCVMEIIFSAALNDFDAKDFLLSMLNIMPAKYFWGNWDTFFQDFVFMMKEKCFYRCLLPLIN